MPKYADFKAKYGNTKCIPERKNNMKNENDSIRTGIYISRNLLKLCDENMPKTNASSRSEFISNAIEMYIAWLNSKENSKVLTPALESVIGAKIAGTESYMKKVNAYYRKNGTMKGFEGISDEKAAEIDEAVKSDYSWITAPYAPYELSNNNAEINRLKKRIESLERREETGFVGWKFEGGEAVANQEENRLQLLFDEKPSEEQRSKLKSWDFRWSPSNKAWQKQLNSNAIYAAGQIEFIRPLDGRTPRELQPKPKSKDEQER